MAIGWPEAVDAAPARRPERSGGWQPKDFLVSRGMGVAQGKKVDRRHCGIGDRGEAGLRPDQPIKEAAWSARSDREGPRRIWRSRRAVRESRQRRRPVFHQVEASGTSASTFPMKSEVGSHPVFAFAREPTFVARSRPAFQRRPRPVAQPDPEGPGAQRTAN